MSEEVKKLSMHSKAINLHKTTNKFPHKTIRVAILQRVCPAYRLGLFKRIAAFQDLRVRFFIGEDIPNSKVQSAKNLSDIDLVKHPTYFVRVFGKILPYHRGLIQALKDFQPDVLLCEGESNFLNYLQAIWYRRRNNDAYLIHWSLGGLPGISVLPLTLKTRVKYRIQKKFDAFITYSNFGKKSLMSIGHPEDKIFVATNVSDTTEHISQAAKMNESTSEARGKLGVPDKFTVLYVGSMDSQKRPEVLLELAKQLNAEDYNFILLGNGHLLGQLRDKIKKENLYNVFLPGRVSNELFLYYRASDVMLIPGRGGMVISEAMAWSLPIIVWQADGTEKDLVQHGENGLLIKKGTTQEFSDALESLRNMQDQGKSYGERGKKFLLDKYTIENMADKIANVIYKFF